MAKDKDKTDKTTGPGSPRRPVKTTTRRPSGRSRARILLVDDSPFILKFTLALLERGRYRVDTAENGAVACRKYSEARYDLVLMDRQMPVMDGLEATREIR